MQAERKEETQELRIHEGFKCHNCYDPATKPHVILKLLNYLTDKGKKTPQKIYLEIND